MAESDLLATDNLESLKEGEIFVDKETGKKYRVRKTILPHYSSSGPHGLGDPDDRTLRRIEADVIIPNRMNAQIERVECNESYLNLVKCFRADGAVKGLSSCKPDLAEFNRCKYEKFHDTAFRERMTEEYLRERSNARKTGLSTRQQKLEEYRGWKKSQDDVKSKEMSKCDLCEVEIPPGDEAKESHENGKRHIKLRVQKEAAADLEESSVFVRWKTKDPVAFQDLERIFSEFGRIDRILHRGERSFGIIEFVDKMAAREAINVGQITCGNVILTVEKRKIEFTHQDAIKPQIDVDQISSSISLAGSFGEQADGLIHLMVLSEKEIQRRLHYMTLLREGLSEYLYSPEVVMFGSSITGVGTIDSDIDATVFIESPPDSIPDLMRDKYTLLTCDPTLFRSRKITKSEILRLTCADRVRLVSKIINEVRKKAGWIGHQRPVLDARCPVVRFNIFKSCLIDLSVENKLGVRKSLYLKTLIEGDASGNLRRVLIAFRFWALSNGLFESQGNQHAGHFNAYILNLLVIYYLMDRKLIPRILFLGNSESVGVWKVDFEAPQFSLSHLDLPKLFKEMFIFCVESSFSEIVCGPNPDVFSSKPDFQQAYLGKEEFKEFKLGCLNLQDPIEHSHNVAQNITEKALAHMKKQMMFALSAMKKSKSTLLTDIVSLSSRPNSTADVPITAVDHHFQFPVGNVQNLPGLKKVVMAIFEEVMLWDVKDPNEPNFKKMRLQESENQLLWQSGLYAIRFPLWVGRRNIKRKIQQQIPAMNGIELEKQVSEELVKSYEKNTELAVVKVILQIEDSNTAYLGLKRVEGSPAEVTNAFHFVSVLISNNWAQILSMI